MKTPFRWNGKHRTSRDLQTAIRTILFVVRQDTVLDFGKIALLRGDNKDSGAPESVLV